MLSSANRFQWLGEIDSDWCRNFKRVVLHAIHSVIIGTRVLLTLDSYVRIFRTFKSMRLLMNYFDQRYNSTKYPIIITENGISSRGNGTDQEPEVRFADLANEIVRHHFSAWWLLENRILSWIHWSVTSSHCWRWSQCHRLYRWN